MTEANRSDYLRALQDLTNLTANHGLEHLMDENDVDALVGVMGGDSFSPIMFVATAGLPAITGPSGLSSLIVLCSVLIRMNCHPQFLSASSPTKPNRLHGETARFTLDQTCLSGLSSSEGGGASSDCSVLRMLTNKLQRSGRGGRKRFCTKRCPRWDCSVRSVKSGELLMIRHFVSFIRISSSPPSHRRSRCTYLITTTIVFFSICVPPMLS